MCTGGLPASACLLLLALCREPHACRHLCTHPARCRPGKGNGLALTDGATVVAQWAAETRPASDAALIDDNSAPLVFYLANVDRADAPAGAAAVGKAAATIKSRRPYGPGRKHRRDRRWHGHHHSWHHQQTYHYGGKKPWPPVPPVPPTPDQCHAYLDAGGQCPAPRAGLTALGSRFVLERPGSLQVDIFYIVAQVGASCTGG